jgi:hypothetical protein
MPGAAHGSAQHPHRVLVTDDYFFFRIPLYLSSGTDGNIAKLADSIAANSRVYGADRLCARFDTVNKIPLLTLAVDKMYLIGAYDRF